MKTSVGQKVKIGIFTVLGISIFLVGIFIIGSKKNMFGNTYMIYGTFKNVGGLEVGNNIRFAGINVGTVKGIHIVSDTLIRVDMLMQNQVKPFLKIDALASIGSDGLMGDKLVTIVSGSSNEARLLQGGTRIQTVNPVDFDKVIGQFTNVANNAETIMTELAGMAIQIRKGDGTISKLLYTDDLSRSLQGTAENAEEISKSMAGIALQIRSGYGSIGNLIYTDSFSNGLERTIKTANTAMTTINEAAENFGENMKALQGNYFLRGYFKRKARKEAAGLAVQDTATDTGYMGTELDEEELKTIISDAQKALDAKKNKK